MELYEELRREFTHGVGSIKGVAKKFGVHRRTVPEAVASAIPPLRKKAERAQPKLAPVKDFIDAILAADEKVHRKQRHTARRTFNRLRQEQPEHLVAELTVRQYMRERKAARGRGGQEVFIAQSYQWAQERQVDWYEAWATLDGQERPASVVKEMLESSLDAGAADIRIGIENGRFCCRKSVPTSASAASSARGSS